MTIKEIAKLAGVCPSTVSRVLNTPDSSAASQETRDRIWAIIRENNFVPNQNAKNLKQASKEIEQKKDFAPTQKNLACIFARTSNLRDEPFFSRIARAAEIEALKSGYLIKYFFTVFEQNSETVERFIGAANVCGILILGRFNKGLIHLLRKHCKNIINVALNASDIENYDQVICDGYKAAVTAVDYLNKQGHTSIGYVGDASDDVRYKGYKDAMRLMDLSIDQHDIINCKLTTDDAYSITKNHINGELPLPSAFFCSNDATAIGVIKALKEKKIAVPNEVSIISVDDIEMAGRVTPALTTIAIPKQELGKMAIKTLISRIENGHRLPMRIELPFQLIKRDSVKKPILGGIKKL